MRRTLASPTGSTKPQSGLPTLWFLFPMGTTLHLCLSWMPPPCSGRTAWCPGQYLTWWRPSYPHSLACLFSQTSDLEWCTSAGVNVVGWLIISRCFNPETAELCYYLLSKFVITDWIQVSVFNSSYFKNETLLLLCISFELWREKNSMVFFFLVFINIFTTFIFNSKSKLECFCPNC